MGAHANGLGGRGALAALLAAIGVLAATAARAECVPLDPARFALAGLVVAGDVESVRDTKGGGREVTVRAVDVLRGSAPPVVTFREKPGPDHCPAAPIEPGRRYLFLLRDRVKGGLAPLSIAGPDWGVASSILPIAADALPAPAWAGGPARLDELRSAAAASAPSVVYEPAAPAAGDRVFALLPAPLGCAAKGWAKVHAGRITSGVRPKKGCAALAAARPWVRVALGRLAPGRYVHFQAGEWLGYLVVAPAP